MGILSIQSHVAWGHVGNAAAVFPLQRLGFDVWPVHTVQLSNHVGYDTCSGQVFSAGHVADVIDGLARRGVLASCDAVLSGYLGEAALGEAVLEAVIRVRAANPRALYLCDPVMGDSGSGLYVRPGIPEMMMDRMVPAADVVTPNQFELERLAGRAAGALEQEGLEDTVAIARRMMDPGPSIVVVTSLRHAATPPDRIEMLAVTASEAWRVSTPYLPLDRDVHGSGDAVAAFFLAHLLATGSVADALGAAAAAIFAVLEATHAAQAGELRLIAAQDAFTRPQHSFPVERIGC